MLEARNMINRKTVMFALPGGVVRLKEVHISNLVLLYTLPTQGLKFSTIVMQYTVRNLKKLDPDVLKLFMLNSAETKIYLAHKC